MKKLISIIIILSMALILLTGCTTQIHENNGFRIVTSFYPMYTVAQELAKNLSEVTVQNMTNHSVGCLHDYTLTTTDLKNIENADMYIFNGLGIENFIEKIKTTYSNIAILDASKGIEGLIEDENEKNAHIWLDIDKYIKQVENVKSGLIECDGEHKEAYERNAQDYLNRLNELKSRINTATTTKKKCLSFSESLAYLEKTMNLAIKTIETDHEQNGLSAETIADAIKYVKDNNIKNIIIDNQTADNNAKTVASETGATVYVLDSMLGGGEGYIKAMEENLKIVESME